jgi:recombination protein RecT
METNSLPTAAEQVKQKREVVMRTVQGLFPSMKAMLPVTVTPEKMMRHALAACSRTPLLLECTRESWMLAMLMSSQTGLEPSTPLGHAYLIPYRNRKVGKMEVQFQVGYKGLVCLAMRGTPGMSPNAQVVYAGDNFDYDLGQAFVHHRRGTERGKLIAVYAQAWLPNATKPIVEVMEESDVYAIRSKSAAFRSGGMTPWSDKDTEPQMWRKTAWKRLANYLPLSTEMQVAVHYDNASDDPDMDVNKQIEIISESEGLDLSNVGKVDVGVETDRTT